MKSGTPSPTVARLQSGTPSSRRALFEWFALMALWTLVVAAPIIAFDRIPAEEQNYIGMLLGMTGVLLIPPGIIIAWTYLVGFRMTYLLQSRGWGTACMLGGLVLGSAMVVMPDGHQGHMAWIVPYSQSLQAWSACLGQSLAGFLVVLFVGLAGVRRAMPRPTPEAIPPPPAAWAAYCAQCHTYVWVRADGSCENGHPASMLSGHYLAHAPPRQSP